MLVYTELAYSNQANNGSGAVIYRLIGFEKGR